MFFVNVLRSRWPATDCMYVNWGLVGDISKRRELGSVFLVKEGKENLTCRDSLFCEEL